MESILLAISGLSLLGVSAVLRRTAEKHIAAVRKSDHVQHELAAKKTEFKPAFKGRTLLHPQVPALLSREAPSALEQ
jgi:hypothetical protein